MNPFGHHVAPAPGPAAGFLAVCDADASDTDSQEVLMLYRHRFITDTWGCEIPVDGADVDGTPADTAVCEAVEETG